MYSDLASISLDEVYSRQRARLLGEYKNQHRQAVSKVLKPSEVILYAWWEETTMDRYFLYLYLATDIRFLWFMPKQFDEKSTILDELTFYYNKCNSVFLKQKSGNLFSKSRYVIHVDHSLSYGMGGLNLTDSFYDQDELEKIVKNLNSLIKSSSESQSDDFLARLEHLGRLKQEGLLTDEEFLIAKKKLLGN